MTILIFDNPKAAFIRIRKTGSTSIVNGLLGGREQASRVFDGRFPPRFRDRFTFAIVRNPYARLVSCYEMFRHHKATNAEEREMAASLSLKTVLDIVEDDTILPGRETYLAQLKQHAIPMSHPDYFIHLADYIGRFENFDETYREIAGRLSLPCPDVPHLRASDPRAWQDYFHDETRKRAAEVFAEDLDRFKYTF